MKVAILFLAMLIEIIVIMVLHNPRDRIEMVICVVAMFLLAVTFPQILLIFIEYAIRAVF